MKHILKCGKCGTYMLSEVCKTCAGKAVSPIPAKYSPEDPYGSYRRKAKKELLKKEGLL